ncbi:MAG: hypothetical protein R2831_06860 [Chitinophagaceae bacterium]
MKISNLTIVEKLREKILVFPSIVDQLQQKDNQFILNLEHWMRDIENIFKNFNITDVSEIAGLRSKILSSSFERDNRLSSRKKQIKTASEVLYDVQNRVLTVYKLHEMRVEESRVLLVQLISIINQTGTLQYSQCANFNDFISKLWNSFYTLEQLRPSIHKVLSLVSQVDALRIIAEEVQIEMW